MKNDVSLPKWQPHSIESEQELLGAILVNNAAFPLVQDFLKAEHFFEPLHAHVYEICERLIALGKTANPITLRTFIPEGLVGEHMTVSKYLAKLAAAATTIVNARDYAFNIRDLAFQRQLMNIGVELERNIPIEVMQVATDAIDAIDAIVAEHGLEIDGEISMLKAMAAAVDAAALAFQNDGQLLGMSTGLADLDQKLLGLHAGDLVILAGRPGMGKTAVALGIARHLAAAGHAGLFFSLEMSGVPLAHRMLSDQMFDNTPIPYTMIRSGKFQEKTFERITDAAKICAMLPITIEQQSTVNLSQIAAKARRHKRARGLKWIMVDYLQLIQASQRYQGNRVQEIGEITAGLKKLARELQVPVILMSQLNRLVEAREDKRPNLGDLRESGNIEQDADVVLMLYREAYYLERQMPTARHDSEEYASWALRIQRCANLLDILVEKQRQGPVGTVRVYCNIGCNAVRDMVNMGQMPEVRG